MDGFAYTDHAALQGWHDESRLTCEAVCDAIRTQGSRRCPRRAARRADEAWTPRPCVNYGTRWPSLAAFISRTVCRLTTTTPPPPPMMMMMTTMTPWGAPEWSREMNYRSQMLRALETSKIRPPAAHSRTPT